MKAEKGFSPQPNLLKEKSSSPKPEYSVMQSPLFWLLIVVTLLDILFFQQRYHNILFPLLITFPALYLLFGDKRKPLYIRLIYGYPCLFLAVDHYAITQNKEWGLFPRFRLTVFSFVLVSLLVLSLFYILYDSLKDRTTEGGR